MSVPKAIGAGKIVCEQYTQKTGSAAPTLLFGISAGPTSSKPAWSAALKGTLFFDRTTNKLSIAGATAWEVVTSA